MSVLILCILSTVPAGQGLPVAQAMQALFLSPLILVQFLHSGRGPL